MTPRIRAHRILRNTPNYQEARLDNNADDRHFYELGKPIGAYHNPDPGGEIIEFYDKGICLVERENSILFRYDEILRVMPHTAKQSEQIELALKGDRVLQLPVRGRQGKFRDSMEMLRFLDRVVEDSAQTKAEDSLHSE
jgi:hypothetical protein